MPLSTITFYIRKSLRVFFRAQVLAELLCNGENLMDVSGNLVPVTGHKGGWEGDVEYGHLRR